MTKHTLQTFVFVFFLCVTTQVFAQNWPQASGPNYNWKVIGRQPPLEWSVVNDANILWRKTLPKGGQSTVTTWGDRAFLTTLNYNF